MHKKIDNLLEQDISCCCPLYSNDVVICAVYHGDAAAAAVADADGDDYRRSRATTNCQRYAAPFCSKSTPTATARLNSANLQGNSPVGRYNCRATRPTESSIPPG